MVKSGQAIVSKILPPMRSHFGCVLLSLYPILVFVVTFLYAEREDKYLLFYAHLDDLRPYAWWCLISISEVTCVVADIFVRRTITVFRRLDGQKKSEPVKKTKK